MNGLALRLARTEETAEVIAFYHKLIEENLDSPYHPDWRIDIYPEDKHLQDCIAAGTLYVIDAPDGGYCAACVLGCEICDGYDDVPWRCDALWEDVVIVHLLCVDRAFRCCGVGRMLVEQVIQISRGHGKRAVRLDVMKKNLPAHKLYLTCGFSSVGDCRLYYEDTGWMDFTMYEYDLSKCTAFDETL